MTIASGRATPGQPKVIAAGAPDFDQARQAFNLAVDQRPQEVAYPSDAGDVAALVRRAREQGLRIAAQRTGHGAQAMDWERPTLLLRTDRITSTPRNCAIVAVAPVCRSAPSTPCSHSSASVTS